jgi:poly [ADP-ribose] polymerase
VEVSWAPNDDLNISLERLSIVHDRQHGLKLSEHGNDESFPMTIDDEVIEIAEQDYGLICPSSGKLVPLKSFHIRGQIIDATVEVILYQVYHNTSSTPIEAKYVFPLDENSTVCGFEAHINNKVIKGVVKEKEQAKQEYREAIAKGHGAYLMHQEQAQIFSVAVGNLPANNEVIIKITYVAELEIENGDIIFRLPAKMSSWQSKQAIESKDQSIVRSIGIVDEKVEFSFKASIRMPYQITKLFSPTHRLRRKLTDCIAMVELVDNILLDRDFILSITLNSANLPRISNETTTLNNHDSQACMLTFYPRFETLTNSNEQVEIIFIIDVSNSMDGGHVQQAKQLAHLFLTNLKVGDGNIYFNVITFGSDNDECFPISTPTTKENLDKAKHFVLVSLKYYFPIEMYILAFTYSSR